MTSRKSNRKKTNCFKELGDSVHDNKDSDLLDPNSITDISDFKALAQDTDLKDTFHVFQDSSTDQFYQIENSFRLINDSITNPHKSFAKLSFRQTTHPKSSSNEDEHNVHSTLGTSPCTDVDNTHAVPSPSDDDFNHGLMHNDNINTNHCTAPTSNGYNFLPPATPHRYWKIVCDDNLEPHRFQSLIKGIILQDDTMHGLYHFYNKIRHAMHTSFKKHINILPPFGQLENIPSLTELLAPANQENTGYSMIKSVYECYSMMRCRLTDRRYSRVQFNYYKLSVNQSSIFHYNRLLSPY